MKNGLWKHRTRERKELSSIRATINDHVRGETALTHRQQHVADHCESVGGRPGDPNPESLQRSLHELHRTLRNHAKRQVRANSLASTSWMMTFLPEISM